MYARLFLVVDAVLISKEETRRVEEILRGGCVGTTRAQHRRAFDEWTGFLRRRGFHGNPLLTEVRQPEDAAALWILYADELHGGPKHLRNDQVAHELTLLRSNWFGTLAEVPFLALVTSQERRNRIFRWQAPSREETNRVLEARRARAKRAAPPEFLQFFLEDVWEPLVSGFTTPTKEQLDRMGACLGAMLGYNFGMRIGNLVRGTAARRDQSVHTGELLFAAVGSVTGALKGVAVSQWLATRELSSIEKVSFHLLKTKTGRPVEDLCIKRTTEAEGRLLDAVLTWIRVSGTQDSDPLLTRYAGGSKRYTTRADVTLLIREAAREFQLPEDAFSSKSFRIGVASADDMSAADKDDVAGWSRQASTRESYYDQRNRVGRAASKKA